MIEEEHGKQSLKEGGWGGESEGGRNALGEGGDKALYIYAVNGGHKKETSIQALGSPFTHTK